METESVSSGNNLDSVEESVFFVLERVGEICSGAMNAEFRPRIGFPSSAPKAPTPVPKQIAGVYSTS